MKTSQIFAISALIISGVFFMFVAFRVVIYRVVHF